jgi:hypothetical protein
MVCYLFESKILALLVVHVLGLSTWDEAESDHVEE